ncbi:MAG: TIGR01244 family sulfur transferase [Pseudomonadota bacterium]
MSDFRQLSDSVFASPQIDEDDIAAAKDLGVGLIVNNRPDGEEPSAPQGEEIEAAARAAGMDYVAIPIGHGSFSHVQVDEMIAVMQNADGATLAYCRSGTRSTLLWALAQARTGESPESIASAAAKAGYDISPIRAMVDMLAGQAS